MSRSLSQISPEPRKKHQPTEDLPPTSVHMAFPTVSALILARSHLPAAPSQRGHAKYNFLVRHLAENLPGEVEKPQTQAASVTVDPLNMPHLITLPEIAALAAQLSPNDRRQLAETILQELATPPSTTPPRKRFWREIRGCVPYPLFSEDAQTWVSRSRRESDQGRAGALGSNG